MLLPAVALDARRARCVAGRGAVREATHGKARRAACRVTRRDTWGAWYALRRRRRSSSFAPFSAGPEGRSRRKSQCAPMCAPPPRYAGALVARAVVRRVAHGNGRLLCCGSRAAPRLVRAAPCEPPFPARAAAFPRELPGGGAQITTASSHPFVAPSSPLVNCSAGPSARETFEKLNSLSEICRRRGGRRPAARSQAVYALTKLACSALCG
jgi:hypothetical protein